MNLDRQMINWLTDNAIPFIVILTKSDKLSHSRLKQRIHQMEAELAVVTIIAYSAKTHQGREEVLEIFEQLY
jgi:GTP-binding protein